MLKANNPDLNQLDDQSAVPIPDSSPGYIVGANGAGTATNIQRIFDARYLESVKDPCVNATHTIYVSLKFHYAIGSGGLGNGPCP